MRNIVKKIFKILKKFDKLGKTDSYINTWDMIKQSKMFAKSYRELYHYYSYVMNVLRLDLKADCLSAIFRYGEQQISPSLMPVMEIPTFYISEQGERKAWKPDKEMEVSLKEETILLIPWNNERLFYATQNIANCNFKTHLDYNTSRYYTELNLCYRENGNHHAAAAMMIGTGNIKAQVYDTKQIFPYVDVDEMGNFITIYDKQKMGKADYRIALLYKLAKEKYKMEKNCLVGSISKREYRSFQDREALLKEKEKLISNEEMRTIENFMVILEENQDLNYEIELLKAEIKLIKTKNLF